MIRILKDELNYLIFGELYLRFDDPGAKRKAFNILESTIQCLERKGFGNVTLEMIAREAGVTRPLLKHYFEDLNELTMTAIKYIRLRFQKLVTDAMSQQKTPEGMLKSYVDSCFHWVDNTRTHANVWLSFLSLCAKKPSYRLVNTSAVEIGEDRIKKLLQNGQATGVFHFENVEDTAKSIQVFITGALITYGSDTTRSEESFKTMIRVQCLSLAGAKLS